MTSREAFESHIMNKYKHGLCDSKVYINKHKDGEYMHLHIQESWRDWKAATARCHKISVELNCPQVAGAIGGEE